MFRNLLIFTATYNEVDNINLWYSRARLIAPEAKILVVDDSSIDGTHEIFVKYCIPISFPPPPPPKFRLTPRFMGKGAY